MAHYPRGGGAKHELLVGCGKTMMIFKEKPRIKEVRVGKLREKRTFSLYLGEKISFLKKGRGKIIIFWANIYIYI